MTDSNFEKLDWTQAKIAKYFKIKNIENSDYYLDMKIDQTKEEIKLSQSFYIKELLRDFRIKDCNFVQILINLNFNKTNSNFFKDLNYINKFIKQAY